MAEEKIFTIPLRASFDSQRTSRSKKATDIVRNYLERYTKAKNIKIGSSINEVIWGRGIQKPPRNVRVHVLKKEDTVYAELIGVEIKTPSEKQLKEKEKKKEEKEKKIKEERKERRKMTIQEEIKEESGKALPKEIKKEEAKLEKTEDEIKKEEKVEKESKQS